MFVVIIPILVLPAIMILFRADRLAMKKGEDSFAQSPYERRLRQEESQEHQIEPVEQQQQHRQDGERRISISQQDELESGSTYPVPRCIASSHIEKSNLGYASLIRRYIIEMDLFGLILLGTSFSLIFLPFSLAPNARNGWENGDMLLMLMLGPIIFGIFLIYEWKFATCKLMPMRILKNKT